MTALSSYYPPNWPMIPFHKGEVKVQKLLQTHEDVMAYAPKMIRPYMPDQHRDFFASQPFLVAAARDEEERLWATLLASPTADLVTSPDPKSLLIDTKPMRGDALEGAFKPGKDVGILGIEFATRRRNRVNGRIVTSSKKSEGLLSLLFRVDQSFGNCPQYIKPRQWWIPADTRPEIDPSVYMDYRSDSLSESQIHFIRQSETIFLATGYRGQGDDPRYGNDASHRGGSPGFVHVLDNKTLIIPDFSGNNHFNTIGNLIVDPRIGISFPNYQTGSMIQITGTARINFDYNVASAFYVGAERLIEISIDAVVWLPEGSIPIRWTTDVEELKERKVVVSAKIKESENVVSFHLRPQDNDLRDLWSFQSGQHLPIAIQVGPFDSHLLERTYSISAGPDWGEYRISVKRQGKASNYLHDNVHIGDTLLVRKPAGDFILVEGNSERPLVLLSSGIGATPLISMLHYSISSNQHAMRKIYWIHGAKNSRHHVFETEVKKLMQLAKGLLTVHIAYSEPIEGDQYDSRGRLSIDLFQEIVPQLKEADIYMCGSDAFVADMEESLQRNLLMPSSQIHFETF